MTDGLLKDKELVRDLYAQEVIDREREVKCHDMGSFGSYQVGLIGGIGGGVGIPGGVGGVSGGVGGGVEGVSGGFSLSTIYDTYLTHPMRQHHDIIPSRLVGSILALLYDVSHPFIVGEEWIR